MSTPSTEERLDALSGSKDITSADTDWLIASLRAALADNARLRDALRGIKRGDHTAFTAKAEARAALTPSPIDNHKSDPI